MPKWLTDDEHRAWRGLLQMTSRLDARLNRDLQQSSGLSLADYDVLVLLTEAPGGTRGVHHRPAWRLRRADRRRQECHREGSAGARGHRPTTGLRRDVGG